MTAHKVQGQTVRNAYILPVYRGKWSQEEITRMHYTAITRPTSKLVIYDKNFIQGVNSEVDTLPKYQILIDGMNELSPLAMWDMSLFNNWMQKSEFKSIVDDYIKSYEKISNILQQLPNGLNDLIVNKKYNIINELSK